MEPESSLSHSKVPCPPTFSILSQLNSVHTPHNTSWKSILILSSHLRLGLLREPEGKSSRRFSHQNPVHASLNKVAPYAITLIFKTPLSSQNNSVTVSQKLK
jgi:hypothetical protein